MTAAIDDITFAAEAHRKAAANAAHGFKGDPGSMGENLLLVGSVPLKTVENVMRTFGGELGPYLPAIPDGETGERKSWVVRLSYQVFHGHIDLDTIKRPTR